MSGLGGLGAKRSEARSGAEAEAKRSRSGVAVRSGGAECEAEWRCGVAVREARSGITYVQFLHHH